MRKKRLGELIKVYNDQLTSEGGIAQRDYSLQRDRCLGSVRGVVR
jgi:hypothetical protein